MNPTHYTQLIPGKQYYIQSANVWYKGTCVNHIYFEDVSQFPLKYLGTLHFSVTDIYYDLDQIQMLDPE